jgi:CheY-like chemotaxis protein
MPPAERRPVLVVEDDQATRAFLLDNLTADGFRAVGASGAGEGLRAIEVRQPALVILDLTLEEGSGLDLLDRIRAADGLASRIDPELPVIVLTGRAGEADRVRSFARCADDHLSKPTCRFLQDGIPLVERATVRRLRRQRENGAARGTNAWTSECRAASQRPHPEHRDPPSLRARGSTPASARSGAARQDGSRRDGARMRRSGRPRDDRAPGLVAQLAAELSLKIVILVA